MRVIIVGFITKIAPTSKFCAINRAFATEMRTFERVGMWDVAEVLRSYIMDFLEIWTGYADCFMHRGSVTVKL